MQNFRFRFKLLSIFIQGYFLNHSFIDTEVTPLQIFHKSGHAWEGLAYPLKMYLNFFFINMQKKPQQDPSITSRDIAD